MSRNNRSTFAGTIIAVRAVEDCIRATKKYTEGLRTIRQKHPVQGENFPSRKLLKHYEYYPEIDLDMTRPFWDAILTTSDWLWGETPCIDILFDYDYRIGRAEVIVKGGAIAMKQLAQTAPGFNEALAGVARSSRGRSNAHK